MIFWVNVLDMAYPVFSNPFEKRSKREIRFAAIWIVA
jgi:hypothetical protein